MRRFGERATTTSQAARDFRGRRQHRKALSGLKAAATQLPEGRAGTFVESWRRPNGTAPRARAKNTRNQGVRIGYAGTGQLGYDPRLAVAYMIRAALRPGRSLAPVTVYDATGVAIATIDPLTRERTPWQQHTCVTSPLARRIQEA